MRERNEALDCAVYAAAALEIFNPEFEQWRDYYNAGGDQVQDENSQQTSEGWTIISNGVTI